MKGVIAWTGGSRPAPLAQISKKERALVSATFRESMEALHNYWGDYQGLCDSVLDMARLQWKRARYDAHATCRHLQRSVSGYLIV